MTESVTPLRPRVRFGTISWGLIVGLGASALLVLLLSPGARDGLVEWVVNIQPAVAILLAVVVSGAVLLLLGLLALIRQWQLRARLRGEAAGTATGIPSDDNYDFAGNPPVL